MTGQPVPLHQPLHQPVVLTAGQRAELLELLDLVQPDAQDRAVALREVIASQRVGDPEYSYVLAGPFGTIREGDGSLEATVAGCRDERRRHWAHGHGRDDLYGSLRVLGYPSVYVYTDEGEDLGRFTGPAQVVPVDDDPLTLDEQAESRRRIEQASADRHALYAHLRERTELGRPAGADTVEDPDTN